jgi:hypothetical protein
LPALDGLGLASRVILLNVCWVTMSTVTECSVDWLSALVQRYSELLSKALRTSSVPLVDDALTIQPARARPGVWMLNSQKPHQSDVPGTDVSWTFT